MNVSVNLVVNLVQQELDESRPCPPGMKPLKTSIKINPLLM